MIFSIDTSCPLQLTALQTLVGGNQFLDLLVRRKHSGQLAEDSLQKQSGLKQVPGFMVVIVQLWHQDVDIRRQFFYKVTLPLTGLNNPQRNQAGNRLPQGWPADTHHFFQLLLCWQLIPWVVMSR